MIRFFLSIFTMWLCFSQSFLDNYTNYKELKELIDELDLKYKTITKTLTGLDLDLIQFGDDKSPAIFILGNLDGSYPSSTELTLNLIRDLNRGKIDRKGKTIYILPMPNPEATNSLFTKVSMKSNTNLNSSDDDHDQEFDEDGPNDLNKDGIISQMRIRNDLGNFKSNKNYKGLLEKVDLKKGEFGQYLLMTEGFDDDNDDKINEDPKGGTNLNKNFTYNYDYFGLHAGKNQVSEPEVKAIIDFIASHPNILLTVHISKFNNMNIKWKPSTKNLETYSKPLKALKSMLKEDFNSYELLANTWSARNNWKVKTKSKGKGSFHEWAYFHAGRWSVAVNSWHHSNIKLDSTFKSQDKMSKNEKLYHDVKSKKLKSAFVDWKKVEHPDFPKKQVDVGGFHLAYLNNPDCSIIDSTNISDFVSDLTKLFPMLVIESIEVIKVKKNLHRVKLTLVNNGKLPTQSKMAELSGWMHPVRVVWNLDKKNIISGTRKTLLKPIAGFAGKQKLEWLIHTKSIRKASLKVESPVIDNITKNITFGD